MKLSRTNPLTVFILLAAIGLPNFAWGEGVACNVAAEAHADVHAPVVATAEAKQEFPAVAQDLEIILAHQVRTFKEKNKDYLVVQMDPSKQNDPIYQKFKEESVEVMISSSGGPFRHIILRVGDLVYDFGSVRNNKVGLPFAPTPGKDKKGVAFVVGKEKVEEMRAAITNFYMGSRKYNNPPFSSVGGKLAVVKDGDTYRFVSKEHVWIPGKKDVNIDAFRNNSPFQGEFLTVQMPDGREKTVLQNPDGVQIPASMGADGQTFVTGFSCASSAVYVLNKFFGIEVFESTSAANLVKKLVEGNNGFASTPDALILYGDERYPAKVPFAVATLDRSQIRSDRQPPQVQVAAQHVVPVVQPVQHVAPAVQAAPVARAEPVVVHHVTPVVQAQPAEPAVVAAVPAVPPQAPIVISKPPRINIPEVAPTRIARPPAPPATTTERILGWFRNLLGN